MVNFAYEIKTAVSAIELFQFYGFEVNRRGFCKSPFSSNDKTPSLKVYGWTRGWHDFSSGKGGDVIDFVREYFGLGFVDAQKKINDDFRLGLPIGEILSREQQLEADRKIAERRRQQQEREKAYNRLLKTYNAALDRWVYLDKLMRENEPKTPSELLINGKYAYAIKNIDEALCALEVATARLNTFESHT